MGQLVIRIVVRMGLSGWLLGFYEKAKCETQTQYEVMALKFGRLKGKEAQENDDRLLRLQKQTDCWGFRTGLQNDLVVRT